VSSTARAAATAGVETATAPVDFELLRAVEQFLIREADYMDDHDYDAWLALWDEAAVYWVPCNSDEVDPNRHVSIINERLPQIKERILRMKGRHYHSQSPKSRLMRVISNVRILRHDKAEVAVSMKFVLGECRLNRQNIWLGRSTYTLLRNGEDFRIREKKVVFINNDTPMINLTFLI
jgi:benzoate/toluate 1,2-dioxygenase beta subunit